MNNDFLDFLQSVIGEVLIMINRYSLFLMLYLSVIYLIVISQVIYFNIL